MFPRRGSPGGGGFGAERRAGGQAGGRARGPSRPASKARRRCAFPPLAFLPRATLRASAPESRAAPQARATLPARERSGADKAGRGRDGTGGRGRVSVSERLTSALLSCTRPGAAFLSFPSARGGGAGPGQAARRLAGPAWAGAPAAASPGRPPSGRAARPRPRDGPREPAAPEATAASRPRAWARRECSRTARRVQARSGGQRVGRDNAGGGWGAGGSPLPKEWKVRWRVARPVGGRGRGLAGPKPRAGRGRRVGLREAGLPGQAGSPPSRPPGPAPLGFRAPARPGARLGAGRGRGAAQAARPGGRREARTAPAHSAPARRPALASRSLTAPRAGRGRRGGGRGEGGGGGGGGGGRRAQGRAGGGGLIVRSPQSN